MFVRKTNERRDGASFGDPTRLPTLRERAHLAARRSVSGSVPPGPLPKSIRSTLKSRLSRTGGSDCDGGDGGDEAGGGEEDALFSHSPTKSNQILETLESRGADDPP